MVSPGVRIEGQVGPDNGENGDQEDAPENARNQGNPEGLAEGVPPSGGIRGRLRVLRARGWRRVLEQWLALTVGGIPHGSGYSK